MTLAPLRRTCVPSILLALSALTLGSTLGGCGGGDDKGAGTGENGSGGNGAIENNDGPTAFLPLHTSGSRLKAVTVREPGSETGLFVIWYDTELETECTFQYAEDGRLRCLPVAQSLAKGFSDAACTETVYYDSLVTSCVTHPPYRHEALEEDGCGVRVIRMEQVSPENVYPESCPETPEQPNEDVTVWRDAEALDPTVFVAAAEHERLNAAGFGVIEIRGEDGSRQVDRILDGTYGGCSPRPLADGDTRCVAAFAFVENWWYSDEGCSEKPLAYSVRSACRKEVPETSIAIDPRDAEPGGPPTLALVGPPIEEGTVYEDSFTTQMCEARDVQDVIWNLHPVLGPFDSEQLRLVSRVVHGEGRIWSHHNVIGDVLLTQVAGAELYDTELDVPCKPVRAGGGGWLCVPENAETGGSVFYADADCSEPVLNPLNPDGRFFIDTNPDYCVREGFADVVLAAYEAVESYTGSLYAKNDDGDCASAELEATDGYVKANPIELAELEETRE